MKEYASELGYKNFGRLGVGVPVNLRAPPKSLEERLEFQNCIGLGNWEFPWIDNFESWMRKGSKVIHDRFKISMMFSSQKIQLSLKYLPEMLNRVLVPILSRTGRIAVSNLSGLKKQISIGGYTWTDTYFITPHVFKAGLSILGHTYNNKFKYWIFTDSSMEAKPKKLIDYIENIIKKEIDKVERHHS